MLGLAFTVRRAARAMSSDVPVIAALQEALRSSVAIHATPAAASLSSAP